MISQIITITILSVVVFFMVNAMGGLAINWGYTSMRHHYRREDNPGFNFIFKTVTPILSALSLGIIFYLLKLNYLNKNIWLVVPGSWLMRIAYNLVLDRIILTNWRLLFIQFALSSFISYWIYSKISINPSLLFPGRDNMVSQLWLIVVLFVYKAMDDLHVGTDKSKLRKDKYIDRSYVDFKHKFGNIITLNAYTLDVEILSYAIMLQENFNRPKIARFVERIFGPLKGTATYGIMQVESTKPLSDAESVEAGVKRLNELHRKTLEITNARNPKEAGNSWINLFVITRTAWHYNNSISYSQEVKELYDIIRTKYYTLSQPADPDLRYNALYSSSGINID